MNKDSTDFMLTEYERISTAYFGLRDQVNEWFKAYLTLVGFPLTVLAAVMKLGNGADFSTDLNNLPPIVAGLLTLVAFLGFFVCLSIISMRLEMILYARTINGIRRYFGHQDNVLREFLILPTSDSVPPFYESWRAMFWQVLLIGFLDGVIFAIGIKSLAGLGWITSALFGLGVVLVHWGMYRWTAWRRESEWKIHFKDNLTTSNI